LYCPTCGASNADNAAVCVQCGRALQGVAPAVAVPNYLVFAILVTVFCCLPSGIAAIIYAAQVNTKLQAGDLAGAQLASRNAKMWVLISVGAGLLLTLAYGLFLVLSVMSHR
jgi:interferon-induced transmembrane protein/zinc ribbon protein